MKDLAKSFLGIALIVAVSFLIGCRYGRKTSHGPEPYIIRDTTTYIVHDTIIREKPVPVTSYIYDTVHTYFTTIRHDTVAIEVPIERKIYHEDSLYHAVVSGPRFEKNGPSLDSLIVWPKTTTITIREQIRTPAPKLSFGATLGPSILATPQGKVHAGIGATLGLTYNF